MKSKSLIALAILAAIAGAASAAPTVLDGADPAVHESAAATAQTGHVLRTYLENGSRKTTYIVRLDTVDATVDITVRGRPRIPVYSAVLVQPGRICAI